MKYKNGFVFLISAVMMMSFVSCGEKDSSSSSEKSVSSQSEESSESEFDYMQWCSDNLVEEPDESILEEREGVEYPKFEKHTYFSNTAGRDTNVNVLLPADYDKSKQYPVLYILHGYWDNEDWMARGVVHISERLANLKANGQTEDMIVV